MGSAADRGEGEGDGGDGAAEEGLPVKTIWYYSHKFGGSQFNLAMAVQRFAMLERKWSTKYPDRVLWAPWFALARAGIDEPAAMHACWDDITISHGIVLDFDGSPLSNGMQAEHDAAKFAKKEILGVDGEDFGEVT